MTTFALVHGACHGAWCWDRLISELEARGHRAVAVDLPTEDPLAGNRRYAEIVRSSLEEVVDDVIVVGHSLGGLVIPLVAAGRPVRRLVFLCAFPPVPGLSFNDQPRNGPTPWVEAVTTRPITHPDGSFSFPEAFAQEVLYPDCSPENMRWAIQRLRRQTTTPHNEVCPLERWPDVESAYVLATEDRAVNPEWSRWVAREGLGVEATAIPGGHSPFLARPSQLADVLTQWK